ncbi:MAG TPA: methionyl-tRNA formyltransferase [Thermoanaerobaculia bacterium]|nr:methionyl-tRNA formyltransferase [Thermoanaerobaculia bacterium]
MRIVFFGSPDFAVPSLDALVDAGHQVVLVVSQPAKPVGRKGVVADPPVASRAAALSLPLFQPSTLKNEEAVARLRETAADLFVVVAYGKILRPEVLSLPRLGCVNVHGSVLPRWRGASPVQAAILAGDETTGISIMKLDAGMDTGPVYAFRETSIGAKETADALSGRLATLGAGLLAETLPRIADGSLQPVAQPDTDVTTCPKITREDGRVDWTLDAAALERRARAFTPWPGLFAFRQERRVKLFDVEFSASGGEVPGTVIEAGDRVVVACGEAALAISRLQAEGRGLLPAPLFVSGERVAVGERWS